jgi:carboxypeptidase Q
MKMKLPMLGLGGSVATPRKGITAEVVIVSNEEELEALGEGARGKIVLFNNPMPPYHPVEGSGYGETVRFRLHGARLASEHGAVGVLVRSVTANSQRTPHTGVMIYGKARRKIPAAAVTIEDAEMIARLIRRGERVKVRLFMEAHREGKVPSANVVAELRGSTLPDEIVVISGHLDSWDVGQGAHDDATGCIMAIESLRLLREAGLRPRRTIRVVLWTNEENGLAGGKSYAKEHADELAQHVAAIESDSGGFDPRGFNLELEDSARHGRAMLQLQELLNLLELEESLKVKSGHSGSDIRPMKAAGVPLLGLKVEGSRYFDYHHTHADTVDKVDPGELNRCVALMAFTAYVLADMPGRLGENW